MPRTTQTNQVFFSLPSTELAGPVLPGSGVLHACALGGQATAAHGPQEPPQVLLDGHRPERQDGAWPPLLSCHRLWPQEDQPPKSKGHSPPPEPPQTLLQKQLQSVLRRVQGRGGAQTGGGGRSGSRRDHVAPSNETEAGTLLTRYFCMDGHGLLFQICVYKGKNSG